MSLKRAAPSNDDSTKIYTSQPIHDRESIFVAFYSPHPGLPPKELQQITEGKTASHRILAWRTPSKQRTLAPTSKILCDSGHDDDGEQWAGKRLESAMTEMDVMGAICVARWYGGVMLGPVRFKHIEDVAKEAVKVWREEQGGVSGKRQRVDEPGMLGRQGSLPETMRPEELRRRKEELVRTLARRDESIVTLRTLLDTKKAELASTPKVSSTPANVTTASPSRKVNYDGMPFARLQALDTARDATIQFLLKQIDKVEEEQKEAAEKKKEIDAVTNEQDQEDIEEAWSDLAASMDQKATSIEPTQKDGG
ncbi:hypothetical protein EG328_004782 [Venturia inaequalis]|uniref:Impact N-terminal domain-containing protein n=1 Tax=Venturia inaequalis TaxID=5025 RepID=A0A8H3VH04_VENIN|nr:hypothetical protein EG328_004782 [Venturia inaequalis]RDI87401.1 hypothetical protein Vi05172_g2662 [Venturia inaequalis]